VTFEARPPAKVNLTLEVGPRLDDGYHPLESVFLRVGLSDRLTIRPGEGTEDRLVVGGLPGCPADGNIVLRALALLRAKADRPLPPLDVELEKRIPIAAGLAGGSSDAAAALALAAAAWGLEPSLAERLALAMELGSDVPFFGVDASAALVEGRGEGLTALPPVAGEAGVLLYCPPVTVSTTAAYARFDELGPVARSTQRQTAELARAVRGGAGGRELAAWGSRLRDANHLWPAAVSLVPALAELRNELEARTGLPWLMSGSGPTLFSLHPTLAAAAATGKRVAEVGLPREGTLIMATDLVGPDPAWRYP
jgi:4-diphosphocytidyl-2-C-methyl-D-erythritol kinase